MDTLPSLPVAMAIAGSDSGGGAGIQADLKTFASLGVFGTSAITAITAQNPNMVNTVETISPKMVHAQISTVGDYFTVGAAKMGMLSSQSIIEAVSDAFRHLYTSNTQRGLPYLVVDPVMIATSGTILLEEDAIQSLVDFIIPMASVITPNMAEASILARHPIETLGDLEKAAKTLYDQFGVPVLVKGGHMSPKNMSIKAKSPHPTISDCLFDGDQVYWFKHPYIIGLSAHGTGCTLSAAIAAFLLQGLSLVEAIQKARIYLQNALEHTVSFGHARALNHHFSPVPLQQNM